VSGFFPRDAAISAAYEERMALIRQLAGEALAHGRFLPPVESSRRMRRSLVCAESGGRLKAGAP